MDKIKVLIVEDEMIISSHLKSNLTQNGYEVIGQAVNYTEALEILENQAPDISLLDITLSGKKSGIDIAKEINEKYKTPFIFLTSNADQVTVNEAKITEPAAYLIKPFNQTEIQTTIEIALYNFSKRKEQAVDQQNLIIKNCLFVKQGKHFVRIDFNDIAYLKSDHIYLDIVLTDGRKHVVRGSLNDYINKLPPSFFRSHRSYIINTDYLTSLNHNEVTIQEFAVPIAKRNRDELLDQLNLG